METYHCRSFLKYIHKHYKKILSGIILSQDNNASTRHKRITNAKHKKEEWVTSLELLARRPQRPSKQAIAKLDCQTLLLKIPHT